MRDHFISLGRAGLEADVFKVGLVGDDTDREHARTRVLELCRKWTLPEPAEWIEAGKGWEQVTLDVLHRDACESPDEYAILYAHTKGAANDHDSSAAWRRSMTRGVVGRWEECLDQLEAGHDAVGCHWVKAPEWPEQEPFFAGNFWWARASYVRTLAPPLNETRWQAETWLSLGKPVIHDMLPGWPEYG